MWLAQSSSIFLFILARATDSHHSVNFVIVCKSTFTLFRKLVLRYGVFMGHKVEPTVCFTRHNEIKFPQENILKILQLKVLLADPPQPHDEHSPLLENHSVLQSTGLLADVRGDLIKKLKNRIDNDVSANHLE